MGRLFFCHPRTCRVLRGSVSLDYFKKRLNNLNN